MKKVDPPSPDSHLSRAVGSTAMGKDQPSRRVSLPAWHRSWGLSQAGRDCPRPAEVEPRTQCTGAGRPSLCPLLPTAQETGAKEAAT